MGLRLCDTCYNYERRNSKLQRQKRKATFIGVKVIANWKKYGSQIKYKTRMKYLGAYKSEVTAAQHFDFVCRILGRTQHLNFPLTQSLPKFNIPDWIQGTFSFFLFFKEFS